MARDGKTGSGGTVLPYLALFRTMRSPSFFFYSFNSLRFFFVCVLHPPIDFARITHIRFNKRKLSSVDIDIRRRLSEFPLSSRSCSRLPWWSRATGTHPSSSLPRPTASRHPPRLRLPRRVRTPPPEYWIGPERCRLRRPTSVAARHRRGPARKGDGDNGGEG